MPRRAEAEAEAEGENNFGLARPFGRFGLVTAQMLLVIY